MSQREGGGKISLALLKGKTAGQSVPSISFRFNPGSDNLTQISDPEDNDDDDDDYKPGILNSTPPDVSHDSPTICPSTSTRDSSPIQSRTLPGRSSSLDGGNGFIPSSPSKPEPPSNNNSFLAKLTKTFEKINEIRNDRSKEKDAKSIKDNESSDKDSLIQVAATMDKSPVTSKEKVITDSPQKSAPDEKNKKIEVLEPLPKSKTSLVKDITEHTSKLRSEINKVKPKLSELRQRKSESQSSKTKTSSIRSRSFTLNSFLRRDEGFSGEHLIDCDGEIDTGIEAQEDDCMYSDVPFDPTSFSIGEDSENTTTKSEFSKMDSLKTASEKDSLPEVDPTPPTQMQLWDQFTEKLVGSPIKFTRLLRWVAMIVLVCFIIPIPRFIAGFLFGTCVSCFISYRLFYLLMPSKDNEDTITDTGPRLLGGLPVYEGQQLHQGWMNELEKDYNPEGYHVTQTHSVFLRLQGSQLQIDHPKKKVPKHARASEEMNSGGFIRHREYNLSNCQVMLFPTNLPRRWLWSRKYPICLRLQSTTPQSTTPVSISSTPATSIHGSPTNSKLFGLLDREGSSESAEGNWSLENNKSSVDEDVLNSSVDMASFEEVTQEMCQEKTLYLFARTDREKDDWFRCFVAATENHASSPNFPYTGNICENKETSLIDGISNFPPESLEAEFSEPIIKEASPPPQSTPQSSSGDLLNFERYMAKVLYQEVKDEEKTIPESVTWVNALAGRLLYDFLHNPYWANKVQERVQRKLSKLHVPYFVGEVVVCGVQLGNSVPLLEAVGTPHLNPRGLWVDFTVDYTGTFTMSLETKLDLMKLKRTAAMSGASSSNPPSPADGPSSLAVGGPGTPSRSYSQSPSSDHLLRNMHFETDTDDSVESSSEDEGEDEGLVEGLAGGSGPTSRKLLRFVDSVAGSKYFQQATESRLLQRAFQGVSNTRIELSVEVRHLAGLLSVNIPPPPTDRLWYGFKGMPELIMVARPRVGDRILNLPFLCEFIQKQLRIIFDKVFVLPNMDDLVIPIMSPLLPGQHDLPRPPWEPPPQSTSNANANTNSNVFSTTTAPTPPTSPVNATLTAEYSSKAIPCFSLKSSASQ